MNAHRIYLFVILSLPAFTQGETNRDRAMKLPELIHDKVFRDAISLQWSSSGDELHYRVCTAPGVYKTVNVNALTGERGTEFAAAPIPGTLDWNEPYQSSGGGSQTSVTFENHLKRRVELVWIDAEGGRRSYGSVQPGESRQMNTFVGHTWLVIESSGDELGLCHGFISPLKIVLDEISVQRRRPADEKPKGDRRHADVFIRDHNVFTRDEQPLTKDGTAKKEYREPMMLSPDKKHLLVMQVEPEQKHLVSFIESSPKDYTQPKLHQHQYLKPGDRIAHPHPRLFDLSLRKQIEVFEDLFPNPWSIELSHWSADSSTAFLLFNQRGHQLMRVVAVDANSGVARTVIEEKSKTFIDYSQKTFIYWLDKTNEAIWMSERDGWNHLWLYDTTRGVVKNQITKGGWVVRKVEHVDEEKRQVWFMACGVVPGHDPYYQHLCRVNLDGSGFVVLSVGDGTHEITFSPDRRFFIDEWSRVDLPPVHELRRSEDRKLVIKLEEANASALLAVGWKMPERFVAKGRDGKTDIFGVIYKPTNFDSSKKYPLVEEIYAGPHSAFVPKKWGLQQRQHQMAELGFIVVQIDGMGTNWRSRAFHDVCWKNLKDAGLPDRIAWIKEAAKTRPWMDLSRVGIYGGSAGGQNVGSAMLLHGDFYKVGVADCGCHDNRMDKIWWNEAWMGWPVGPEYADSSNVTHAAKLTGRLMLIVGEMDANVDPASTMQVAAALTKAKKDYELVVVPGTGHGAAETPFGFRKRMDFLVEHLNPTNKP